MRRWILRVHGERIVESECVLHMSGQNGRGEEGDAFEWGRALEVTVERLAAREKKNRHENRLRTGHRDAALGVLSARAFVV